MDKSNTGQKAEKGATRPVILVVEDDQLSQNLMKFLLQDQYTVHIAPSVAAAKQLLNDEPVALILLDLSLEGDEDGLDLTRYLRQTAPWQNLPIIAVTAHAFVTDRDNALNAGCNDYLSKPIRQNVLKQKIEDYLVAVNA